MTYAGESVNIPLGSMGIYSDDSQTITPPQGLLRAINCQVKHGFIEKEPGSMRWNEAALPAPVVAIFDWWPNEITQRTIAVTQDGRVWRFTDYRTLTEVMPSSPSSQATLRISGQVVIVAGGQEAVNRARKLFIFTGNDPVQVIEGDGTTRRDLLLPALDWSVTHYPSFGIIHGARMWAFGNINNPHMLYGSNVNDHEDFNTFGSVALVPVHPGQAERILSAENFKGRLVLIKYPLGIYFLDESDAPNYFTQKIGDSFGGGSAHCALQVLDDLWIANSSGSITSLTATLALGGLQQGDVLKNLKCIRFMQDNTGQVKTLTRAVLWYEAKKIAMFTYQGPSSQYNDRIFYVDYHSGAPRATFSDKDQPNCLALIRDVNRVPRPFYGSNDGFIYAMDQEDRNVGGQWHPGPMKAYTMTIDTPDIDFGFLDRRMAELNKNFDFLEVAFEPQGSWDLLADIFIDSRFVETVRFNMSQGPTFDGTGIWDKSLWDGAYLQSRRVPIHGMGRRISVRFYQAGLNENAKIASMTFYYRLAGQEQKGN